MAVSRDLEAHIRSLLVAMGFGRMSASSAVVVDEKDGALVVTWVRFVPDFDSTLERFLVALDQHGAPKTELMTTTIRHEIRGTPDEGGTER